MVFFGPNMVLFETQEGDVSKTTIFLLFFFEVFILDLSTLSFFGFLLNFSSFGVFIYFLLLFRKSSLYVLVVVSCCFLACFVSFFVFLGGLFCFWGVVFVFWGEGLRVRWGGHLALNPPYFFVFLFCFLVLSCLQERKAPFSPKNVIFYWFSYFLSFCLSCFLSFFFGFFLCFFSFLSFIVVFLYFFVAFVFFFFFSCGVSLMFVGPMLT